MVAAAALALGACGGDDGDVRGELQIAATRLLGASGEPDACSDAATRRYVREVYVSIAACRQRGGATSVTVGNADVDGDRATATLTVGSARGSAGFAKEGGEWKVDELGADFVRAGVNGLIERGDGRLGDPVTRACVRGRVERMSDADIRALTRPTQGGSAVRGLRPLIGDCAKGARAGAVSDRRRRWEGQVAQTFVDQAEARVACILRRLRKLVSEDVLRSHLSDKEDPEVRRAADSVVEASIRVAVLECGGLSR